MTALSQLERLDKSAIPLVKYILPSVSGADVIDAVFTTSALPFAPNVAPELSIEKLRIPSASEEFLSPVPFTLIVIAFTSKFVSPFTIIEGLFVISFVLIVTI